MGHMVGKDVYRKLGRKIDNLTMRAPWNEALHTFMRGVLGAFLKLPPVKRALMSDTLRSSFLETMKRGA